MKMARKPLNMRMLQIDVPEPLLEAFDRALEKLGIYSSRSEAIRALMQRLVEEASR